MSDPRPPAPARRPRRLTDGRRPTPPGPAAACGWRTSVFARVALALTLSVPLPAGCAVDQRKEVAKYRDVLDAGAPAVRPLDPGEPLALDRALLLANQHNEQLALRGEDYVQALIAKDRAFAAFLPTISLAPTYTIRDASGGGSTGGFVITPGGVVDGGGTGTGGTGTGAGGVIVTGGGSSGTSGSTESSSLPVTGRLNVFNGFRDAAELQRAGYTIEQRRALLLDLQAIVLLDTASAFYEVLRAERSAAVLESSLATQGENLRLVRAQAERGIVGPLEVSQSLTQEAGTRVSLSQARADVRNGRSALAFLIGAPEVDGPLVDEFAALPAAPPPLDDLERDAAAARQDLVAARAATEAARANVAAAIRQYYPSVTLNLNYILYQSGSGGLWSGSVQGNLPIFTGGQIEADVRTAWSQFRQANENEALLVRQIRRDLRQAYENLLTSRQKLADLKAQVEAAETAFRVATERYRQGTISNLDRLTTQDQLLNAQLQLAGESYNQKVFYLNLVRVAGRLDPSAAAGLSRAAAAVPTTMPATSTTTGTTLPTGPAAP